MVHPDEQPKTHEIGRRTYVVADVDPLDADGVRTVAVGTIAWLVGFVMLLPFYGRLKDDGHLWWLWTCLAGFGLGLAGWDFCVRRRRRQQERDAAEAGPSDVPADPPVARAVQPPAPQPPPTPEPRTEWRPEPEPAQQEQPAGVPAERPRQKPPFMPR